MSILCKLGLHDWSFHTEWTPDFRAPIVTNCKVWRECKKCPKSIVIADAHFDPDDGHFLRDESK